MNPTRLELNPGQRRQFAVDRAEMEVFSTGPPVADALVLASEDPFIAPVLFEGVEHWVLPDAVADAVTVCQFLVDALDEFRCIDGSALTCGFASDAFPNRPKRVPDPKYARSVELGEAATNGDQRLYPIAPTPRGRDVCGMYC